MSPPTESPSDPPDSDELAAQLDELEATLTDLRSELRGGDRRGPPQPPQLSELLRFTEQYTIPTLIAILEATIRSLELLRRTLRLADPERAAREESAAARGRLDEVGSEAGQQFADALTELRTALSEADLPENADSHDLITDAHELTGEIESRLSNAEQTVSDHRDHERRDDQSQPTTDSDASGGGGVRIDVSDDGAAATRDESEGDHDVDSQQPTSDNGPEVDVDAELESIKADLDDTAQEFDEQSAGDAAGDDTETADHDDTETADHDDTEIADRDSNGDTGDKRGDGDTDTRSADSDTDD